MIKVAIIEDDREVLEHIGMLINAQAGFACIHQYESIQEAIDPLFRNPPDVLLLDISLSNAVNGIQGVALFTERGASFETIMFSVHQDDERVFDSLCAGACGYLTKNTPLPKLLAAIKEANNGGAPMSMQIARMVVKSFRAKPTFDLSAREKEVLVELAAGKSYRKIGESLFISEDTVRAHIRNIYRKLEVSSKAAAVAKAYQARLL